MRQIRRIGVLALVIMLGASLLAPQAVAESAAASPPTRADVVAEAMRTYPLPMSSYECRRQTGGSVFSDVRPAHEHFTALNCAAHYGIISGYADGTFRPDEPVSEWEEVMIRERAVDPCPQRPSPWLDVSPAADDRSCSHPDFSEHTLDEAWYLCCGSPPPGLVIELPGVTPSSARSTSGVVTQSKTPADCVSRGGGGWGWTPEGRWIYVCYGDTVMTPYCANADGTESDGGSCITDADGRPVTAGGDPRASSHTVRYRPRPTACPIGANGGSPTEGDWTRKAKDGYQNETLQDGTTRSTYRERETWRVDQCGNEMPGTRYLQSEGVRTDGSWLGRSTKMD